MSQIIGEWIDYMRDIIASMSAHWVAKGFGSMIVSAGAYLFGIKNFEVLTALSVLIVIEFLTQILLAYKNKQPIKEQFSSTAALKLVVYGLLISSANLTESIVPGSTFIDDGVITFLAITELIKVLKNTGSMGFAVPLRLLNYLEQSQTSGNYATVSKAIKRD